MKNSGHVAVIGAGAWGTALALTGTRGGNQVRLWGRDPTLISQIRSSRKNERYLPGIELNANFHATTDLAEAVRNAGILLVVTPAQSIGEVCSKIRPHVESGTIVVCCCKGIDRNTGKLPGETAAGILAGCPVAALSGPSFAVDVARELPTAVTIASDDPELSDFLAARLSTARFRCYASDDPRGVELGGALKNVIALGVGATRGMRLGASAEAALIARGFAEMRRIAAKLGARPETLGGLSGLGDLVLTCSSAQSRNFTYGMALGRGEPLDGLKLAEGAFTAPIAADLAQRHDVDAPIIDSVANVLGGSLSPTEAVRILLERPLRKEAN